jgi:regulator of replication initiation timing
LKKDNVENLKRHIETLEATVARLQRENERLDYENKVLKGREDFVQEMYADYRKLLDETAEIKEKYLSAISEFSDIRKEDTDRFKDLLKQVKRK